MTLGKLTFILFIPFFAVIAEYSFQKKAIPSRKDLKNFINDGSIINLGVKKIGVGIKEIIGSKKFGNICVGKNDFLFYCPEQDGSPLLDLFGNFSPIDRKFMMPLKSVLTPHKDKVFYLTVPNKSKVYSEYLPYSVYFKSHGIAPWMSIQDKDLLDSKKYLSIGQLEKILSAKDEYPTYYKQDTHWNSWGAYLALKALNISGITEEIKFKIENYPHPDIISLIAAMGKTIEPADQKIVPTSYEVKLEGDENSIAHFYNQAKTNKVLVIGDSFRTSFSPVLAQYFHQIDEVHLKNFSKHQLNLSDYQYIFVIQVERYLRGQFQ
jgi:hypothetical protein